MRVLVACEESQRVCIAFREKGHEAYSCDIQPCSGGHPEWHIQANALEVIKIKWDLIIAHPPCTYLSNVGAVRMFPKGELDEERYKKALEAREFFMKFLKADCPKTVVENPMPLSIMKLPKPDCIIEPWQIRRAVQQTYVFMAERTSAFDSNKRCQRSYNPLDKFFRGETAKRATRSCKQ